jgi:hypothetical protein
MNENFDLSDTLPEEDPLDSWYDPDYDRKYARAHSLKSQRGLTGRLSIDPSAWGIDRALDYLDSAGKPATNSAPRLTADGGRGADS